MLLVPKILIVDDDQVNLYLLELLLSEEYEVIKFFNSFDVIDYLKKERADLVISDLSMPGLDGFQLLEETKRINPGIPFLFLSAQVDDECIRKAEKLGSTGYLFKPVDFKMLFDHIEKAIK